MSRPDDPDCGPEQSDSFIAIYRWQVDPAHEASFRERWRERTLLGRDYGALGSCLTRDENGEFVAIALWPSEAARSQAFERMGAGAPWPGVRRLQETKLTLEDDLWLSSPFESSRPHR